MHLFETAKNTNFRRESVRAKFDEPLAVMETLTLFSPPFLFTDSFSTQ